MFSFDFDLLSQSMDSFGGGGGFGGGGYMQDGGGFGSPMTDSQEKKVSAVFVSHFQFQ